ncbi:MAG: hypothetical protein RL318_2155 [Fibrobacterota bacterium]|jgi:hypothetical protein
MAKRGWLAAVALSGVAVWSQESVPSPVPSPGIVPALLADSSAPVAASVRKVPLVVRSTAPVGAIVSLGEQSVTVDSSGRWSLSLLVDSLVRSDSAIDLCLQVGLQKACSSLRPKGFDTLEIAPLAMKVDSIVETRDTVITTVVDSVPDTTTHLKPVDAMRVSGDGATKTVVIKGKRRPPRMVGQEKVTIQTIKRMPGLAEPDVMRAVQALPGVVTSSDFSTKVYVRGSNSDQNLVLFDNAVVYNPAHLGGLFSTFLSDATGGLDFYKGGYDARYGNRLASVLLVSSKAGGWDADSAKAKDTWFKGATRITVVSGSAEVEGRQGEFNWVLAGRRTWIDAMLWSAKKLELTDFSLDYKFWDAQGSAAWGRGPDSVRVSAYSGRDALVADPLSLDWGNLVVPVNVRYRLGDGLTWLGTVSRSTFDQNVDVTGAFHFGNSIKTTSTRHELQWDVTRKNQISGGYEYSDYDALFIQQRLATGAQTTDSSVTSSHGVWLQDRVQLGSVTLTGGLRSQYYTGKSAWTFDPRLTASWAPTEDWRVDGHVGMYHQPITSLRMADIEMPTEFWYPIQGPMAIPVSVMTSAGVERANLTDWKLRAGMEVYSKQMEDLPLYYNRATASEQAADSSSPSALANSFTTAQGWAMGAEWKLAKEDGWWTGSLSYSLAWSAIHQDPYTTSLGTTVFDPYWADWDQRSTFKANGEILWKGPSGKSLWSHPVPGRYFRSSFQLNYNSGHPYTGTHDYYAVANATQDYPTTYLRPSDHNGLFYPNYLRLDVTPVDIGRTGVWRFYWTILNLTNHKNVLTINYDNSKSPPLEKRTYQFPLLPIFLGYEREF